MARERMVTRTIKQSTIEIMCINVTTADVTIEKFNLGGEFNSHEEALKKCKKIFETEEKKLVHIESIEVKELLLGMSEDEFIRLAKVLPNR